jgi:hypothetical protein
VQRRNTKHMFGLSIQGTHVDIWAASKLLLPSGPGDQPCLRKPGGMAQSDTQLVRTWTLIFLHSLLRQRL